jgi:hypothetical protein
VRPKDLIAAVPFAEVQRDIADITKNRIVVGHALSNDFEVGPFCDSPAFAADGGSSDASRAGD